MKQLILLLLAIASCFFASAQLRADAGPDTAWCEPGPSAGPRLGGTIPAFGGTPPYTYQWLPTGINAGYVLLDTQTSAHPRPVNFSGAYGVDSVFFQLRVTDSTGAIARDTVKVSISRTICCLADHPIPKRAADTVRLWPASCCNNSFGPATFLHWNTSVYLSDSTDPYARCWCPINDFHYSSTFIDRIGCPVPGWVDIYIQPTAVSIGSVQEAEITVTPNPVTAQSELRCGTAWIGSKVVLTTSEGRAAGSFTIHGERTLLNSVLPKMSGVYQYRVVRQSGQVAVGKFVRQ